MNIQYCRVIFRTQAIDCWFWQCQVSQGPDTYNKMLQEKLEILLHGPYGLTLMDYHNIFLRGKARFDIEEVKNKLEIMVQYSGKNDLSEHFRKLSCFQYNAGLFLKQISRDTQASPRESHCKKRHGFCKTVGCLEIYTYNAADCHSLSKQYE